MKIRLSGYRQNYTQTAHSENGMDVMIVPPKEVDGGEAYPNGLRFGLKTDKKTASGRDNDCVLVLALEEGEEFQLLAELSELARRRYSK